MKRFVALAATFLVSTSAFGAEAFERKKPKTPPTQTRAKERQATPQEAVMKAKKTFRIAAELCSTPGRCDPSTRSAVAEYVTMLKNSELEFVNACEVCATTEKCEAERLRIRDLKRSPGAAPCEEPKTAQSR